MTPTNANLCRRAARQLRTDAKLYQTFVLARAQTREEIAAVNEAASERSDTAGRLERLPSGSELLDHWLRELGESGAARILRAVADAYPRELSNEEIGAAAQILHTSGSFGTYMSKLRSLELVQTHRGMTKASDELFD